MTHPHTVQFKGKAGLVRARSSLDTSNLPSAALASSERQKLQQQGVLVCHMADLPGLENSTEKPFSLCFASLLSESHVFLTPASRDHRRSKRKVQARFLLKSSPANDSGESLWVKRPRPCTLSQGRCLHPQQQNRCGAAWSGGCRLGTGRFSHS